MTTTERYLNSIEDGLYTIFKLYIYIYGVCIGLFSIGIDNSLYEIRRKYLPNAPTADEEIKKERRESKKALTPELVPFSESSLFSESRIKSATRIITSFLSLDSQLTDGETAIIMLYSALYLLNKATINMNGFIKPVKFTNLTNYSDNSINRVLSSDKMENVLKAFLIDLRDSTGLDGNMLMHGIRSSISGSYYLLNSSLSGINTLQTQLEKEQKYVNLLNSSNKDYGEGEISYLTAMSCPNVLYNAHHKLPMLFNTLFLASFAYLTTPRDWPEFEVTASILDLYGPTESKIGEFIDELNMLTRKEFTAYLRVCLYFINMQSKDCTKLAIDNLYRYLYLDLDRLKHRDILVKYVTNKRKFSPSALKKLRLLNTKLKVAPEIDYLATVKQLRQKVSANKRIHQNVIHSDSVDKSKSLANYAHICSKYNIGFDKRFARLINDGLVIIYEDDSKEIKIEL